ncbi:MAG: protein translocase subunit SecD, partial [Planctomycetota bacterium]
MINRFIIIGLVFLTTLGLMAVNNKLLVGEQELHLELRVEEVNGRVPAGTTIEGVLSDLGGREINAQASELEAVLERLRKSAVDPDLPEIDADLDSLEIDPVTRRILFSLNQESSLINLRRVIANDSYRRRNPPQSLFYAPLGIDLRGGVEFRIALYDDDGQRVSADADTVEILRNRLDARGLSEPQVSRLSNGDVQVVIPGGTQADAARTRRVLQTAGRLEFREVLAVYGGREQPREPGHKVIEVEPGVYELDASEYLGFNEVLYPQRPEVRGESPRMFYRLGRAVLTGQDVAAAYPTVQEGGIAVGMTFTSRGASLNNSFTSSIHRRGPQHGDGTGTGLMAISLDGFVESAPVIRTPSGRSSVITGNFSQEEVDQLATVLKAGSLAVTPQVMAERVVGPSLGADTVAKAMWAMIAALGLILVVMAVYYRRIGIVAVTSLATAVALVLGVLIFFGATLTLPGIAGLVLTVGMAVDANILIFERIREELANDSDLPSSIEAGYGRALSAIIDANVTTFLVALILYMIGSGPIQGFGLTLMIGIATSMFAAVYVGRTVTNLLYGKRQTAVVPDYVGTVRLPYVKWRFAAFGISSLMIIAGVLEFFVFTNPNNNFDIDFTGGNMIQVTFTEEVDKAEIDAGLRRAAEAGLTHLGPGDAQVQPYYQGFAAAGAASQQWMFRARDDEAAQLERELSVKENTVARLLRDANALRTREDPQEREAAALDREREALLPEVRELQERIGRQTQVMAEQLRTIAYPGLIAEPGSEVLHAGAEGRTIELGLGLIDELDEAAANRLSEMIAQADDITTAQVRSQNGSVFLRVEFTDPPRARDEFDLDEAAATRIRTLIAEAWDDADEEAVNGAAVAAFRMYARLGESLAQERIRTTRPFPSQEHFSGLVATQMKVSAALALAVALMGIMLYVAARFEFRYGVGAVVALFHDVPITLGLLVLLGARVDLTVVAALLTII